VPDRGGFYPARSWSKKDNALTDLLFREDAYKRECQSVVTRVTEKGYILDATVFYPQGGGQPGDTGVLVGSDGTETRIVTTIYDDDRTQIVHVPEESAPALKAGSTVTARLDWEPRFARMRIHTALHLLSVVLPYPVTGGAIGSGDGRLDFDIQDAGLDKAEIAEKLNALIDRDAALFEKWITDAELEANPGLVKTMSVKPPRGAGRVRLIEIDGIDLQPCGGTHVRSTAEIGHVLVTDIQKKGKQNRRVRIALA
jgi:misacylated tRNA(Ala) deacylase